MRKFLLTSFAIFIGIASQAQIISTVAGGGTGDGGSAIAAPINRPSGTAIDASGNLYIADTYNQRIRKVTTTGVITTVAGNGTPGHSGDGSAATSAQLSSPYGVAVDASGNLYIADNGNNRIRKVTATTGVITTVAGNGNQGYSGDGSAATSAQLNSPYGVAIDASGNLYIADQANHRIRKVIATTGVITTVAGNGNQGYSGDGSAATSAQLNSPYGVAIDASGNLYIADFRNHRIRKVTAATGVIITVVGNGISGFSGDGNTATSAQLSFPKSVAVDASGNFYITDNQRIRKVTAATGVITTVAGNGIYGFSGDGSTATSAMLNFPLYSACGIAIDASRNLFISDNGNNRIRKVTAATGVITTVAGNGTEAYYGEGSAAISARLYRPSGVAIDASGNLYIADTHNQRIRKVTATTGAITTVAGNGTQGYSGDGSAATSAMLHSPYGVAVDASGNLYIVDSGNDRIRKVTAATGVITTVAGNGTPGYTGDGSAATSAQLNSPYGIAIDASGNLYIADQVNSRIRKVSATTGVITTVAGNGTQGYSGDAGSATSAQLNHPTDVAVDASGNLYIADQVNSRIRKVSAATGVITTVAGNGTQGYSGDGSTASSAKLNAPCGVAIDVSGNIYIADSFNNRIRKITTATGIITTVAGSDTWWYSGDGIAATSAQLNMPSCVAVDASGNLYIADNGNDRIRKVVFPLSITVTANASQSKVYGSAEPTLTYSATPALQSGDAFTGALSRAIGESVGAYAINQGNLSAGANYTISFVGDNFSITKATPAITWNDPASITTDMALSPLQLNATADVPGTFVYTPPAGTTLGVGSNQALTVVFSPTDDINYNTTSKTVQISVTTTSGIKELSESMIDVSPNPTTSTLTISGLSEFSKGSDVNLFIVDVSGKTILTKRMNSATNSETIDTGGLANGVYFINIQTNIERVGKRFVKQ